VYLVRHAEKAEAWPQDRELDSFWPLSPVGMARAEALAARLEKSGIAAVYTSRTTRTLATAMPLVQIEGCEGLWRMDLKRQSCAAVARE
jgi:broad specificity phosphatase PhoE